MSASETVNRIKELEGRVMLLERVIERFQTSDSINSIPDQLKLDPDEYIPCSQGFYELEYDGEGVPYRWTGPHKDFSFWLDVNRMKDLEFKIIIGAPKSEAVLKGARVTANGVPLDISIKAENSRVLIKGILPSAGVSKAIPVRLSCYLGSCWSPADDGQSQDVRSLGVAFYGLEVSHA